MKLKTGIMMLLVGIAIIGFMASSVSAGCTADIERDHYADLHDFKMFGECEVTASFEDRYTLIGSAASYLKYPFLSASKEPTPNTYCFAWAWSWSNGLTGGADTDKNWC